MLLRLQIPITPVSAFAPFSDQSNAICSSFVSNPSNFYLRFNSISNKVFLHQDKSLIVSCKSSRRGSRSWDRDDDEFLQAFVLASETIRHYYLRRQGFPEEKKWHSSGQLLPGSIQSNEPKSNFASFGHGFLHRFQSPTIFLKIACDGDLLLPIVVGEFAIETLVGTFREDRNGDRVNQFKFMRNLVRSLGYEPGENATISVDARPSDAINLAERCKAPIYVSKDIVLTDAIRIVYGKWKGNDAKSIYDVSLDSASEGPDKLAEELDLIIKMNLAASEERYNEAAMWRDKLTKLRMSKHEL